jgi:hypothetical protein
LKGKELKPNEWETLESIAKRMNKKYPYFFLMCYPGDEDTRESRHGYEVVSEEDEKQFLGSLSKKLKFKGFRNKPGWWPK